MPLKTERSGAGLWCFVYLQTKSWQWLVAVAWANAEVK
jgi:hypothetical protein